MSGEHTLYHTMPYFCVCVQFLTNTIAWLLPFNAWNENRCLITFYVTITQTLITSLIVPNCISELYTEMLIITFVPFSQLYLNCMNKNWFSLNRVISQINELVSYNIKLGMLHFDNMNQYRAISLHHMLLFQFVLCVAS